MNLLLLLSALLSALTGASGAARTAPSAAVAQQVVAQAAVTRSAEAPRRPAQPLPRRIDAARGRVALAAAPARAAPLYLLRRRE